jgi:hypothetical protein
MLLWFQGPFNSWVLYSCPHLLDEIHLRYTFKMHRPVPDKKGMKLCYSIPSASSWDITHGVQERGVEMYWLLEACILKYRYIHDLIYAVFGICLVRMHAHSAGISSWVWNDHHLREIMHQPNWSHTSWRYTIYATRGLCWQSPLSCTIYLEFFPSLFSQYHSLCTRFSPFIS